MLIHLFGFLSSWGLGAGSDSSPQASSCTCELKWSAGGQRQYCGGKGWEETITHWVQNWSTVLVCMFAQSYTTIAATILTIPNSILFHPGLTFKDTAITITLLHCSWATCNNGSPSYTNYLIILYHNLLKISPLPYTHMTISLASVDCSCSSSPSRMCRSVWGGG